MSTLDLHHLPPRPGADRKSRRIGRGHGSGRGTYSGRGMKGQRARSGGRAGTTRRTLKALISHLPKFKGMQPVGKLTVVTTGQLERMPSDAGVVDAAALRRAGMIRSHRHGLKVLFGGPLSKALTVKAQAFSARAKATIEAAGGKAITVT